MTKIKIIVFSILSIVLTSCNTPVTHPWQLPGDDRQVMLNTSQWPIVSQSLYVAVPEDKVPEAAELLKTREYIELAPEQEKAFSRHLSRPENSKLKPYLIRGVTMGTPMFSILRKNPETNEILISRATWNGEMTIPFVKPRFGIWPVVIYLERPPMRVYPTAVYGGDWIMHAYKNGDTRIAKRKKDKNIAPVTLKDMLYVDMLAPEYMTQHPLICNANGDYPDGSEMIFVKKLNPRQWVHAVFPEKMTVPENLKNTVVLHGHFQKIKNKAHYKYKKPGDYYEYFVVSSWEYKK